MYIDPKTDLIHCPLCSFQSGRLAGILEHLVTVHPAAVDTDYRPGKGYSYIKIKDGKRIVNY